MPNAYNDKPLLDPKFLRKVCEDHGIPYENWFGKPNSMRIPLGRGPGRGFVLMRKEDLDAIDQTTYHDLQFSGLDAFKKIYVVSAECISPGGPDDVGDVFLVELADRRIALEKIPCSAAYNLRAADGSAIITATQNSGTDWTWQQILNDLWTLLGAGSTPTLPFTPDATPENFDYRNSFAWAAITDFLDRLACAVKYNPFTDVFTIVRLGSADATAASAADNYVLVWDSKPFDTVPAARPEKVRVLFRRFPSPSDRGNEYYAVDVTLTATTGTVSGSFVTIYDDLGALASTGTPSNSSALSTRATERANDWLRKHDGFDAPSVQVFDSYEPTAINILGSTCGEIAYDDRGAGAKTSAKSQPTRALENWRLPLMLPVSSASAVKSGFGAFSASSFVTGSGGGVYVPPSTSECLWLPSISTTDNYNDPVGNEDNPYWNIVCSISAYFATLMKLADTRYEIRGVVQYLDNSNVWQDIDTSVMFNANEYMRTVTIGADSADIYLSSGPGFFNDDTYSTYGGNWTTNIVVPAYGYHIDPNGGSLYGVYVRPAVLVYVATGDWSVSFLGRITAFRTFNQDAVMATP